MIETNLVIPCHWDYETLNVLAEQNKEHSVRGIKISEIYGAIPGESIGNGRSPNKVSRLTRAQALEFRAAVEQADLKFNYLLNNSLPFAANPSQNSVFEYLDWIVKEFNPEALVVASRDLMKMIRTRYGTSIPLHVSTIAGVRNGKDLKSYGDIRPEKVVIHNDLARDFSNLKELISVANDLGIKVEIMTTESCLRRCSFMQEHRDHISNSGDDSYIQCRCNIRKLSHPYEILRANFVRPEDMMFYESFGIHSFKITGRSKPASWLPVVTRAYLGRVYDGNLIRLLGIDPNLHAEDWVYLNNKPLDGFIQNFPLSGSEEEERKYCEEWALKLFKTGDFKIAGLNYSLEGNQITCTGGLSQFKQKYYPNLT